MVYTVGSKINLREEATVEQQPAEKKPSLYVPGARIAFVKMLKDLNQINAIALSGSASA